MSDLLSQLRNAGGEDVAAIVEDARREVRYLVTDFTFEIIVGKFKEEAEAEGDIYVPEYQRKLAWSNTQQSYLIESLMLRYPIPPIFLYDTRGRLEIVDGTQRIRSMVRFARGELKLEGLEKLEVLNGFRFAELPHSLQLRLNNTPIRAFILDDTTDDSTRADLFRRLNTSGQGLRDAEIRKGVFKGPFMDLILECAASELFQQVAPKIGGRLDPLSEREELVTRFFVYSDHYLAFRHDVRKFLDQNVVNMNTLAGGVRETKRAEFTRVMEFIRDALPGAFYRDGRGSRVPRVRFEAVAVGTALALRENSNLGPTNADWLESREFAELVRTDASNSGPKLRARIEFVRDRLLGR